MRDSAGPVQVTRYNTFRAATLNGVAQPGAGTGDVLATMEKLANQVLPRSMTYEWTELSTCRSRKARSSRSGPATESFSAFVLGVVLVFLVLAGLYESWSLPLAVILVVPMCLLSALVGSHWPGWR